MRRTVTLPWSLVTAIVLSQIGCNVPGVYRRQADRAAYDIIAKKQAEALGRTEPFTIEPPAETLRRRLLLDQQLLYTDSASLGTREITPIKQWPDDDYLKKPSDEDAFVGAFDTQQQIRLTLVDALQLAARESREYQSQKEQVFQAALQLDLQRDSFRRTWSGVLEGLYQTNLEQEVVVDDRGNTDRQPVSGLEYGGAAGLTQRFKNGLTFTGLIGLDLVKLLTQDKVFSRGVYADASVSIPLLRGAGKFVVTEPLTQAERNVVYAIYEFERFKHEFAVQIADDYLGVLQQGDQVQNQEQNYRSLITSTRRARRLADAGRSSEIEVDQSRQAELSARNQWIVSVEGYRQQLDAFKLTLGLPADADIDLDPAELENLSARARSAFPAEEEPAAEGAAPAADEPITLIPADQGRTGPYEMKESDAIPLALEHRLDLRVALGRVHDAQRGVAVAADQLRADLTLLGSGAIGERRNLGSAGLPDANLHPEEGSYSALLSMDFPLERTAERNEYRLSLIQLEQAVRSLQQFEDQIKLAIRTSLSRLLEFRETVRIQMLAVAVAERRVSSTDLFLLAGRAEMRDRLDAQDSLLRAQNALTAAMVRYRIAELALQRDLGLLEVNERGLWREYIPEDRTD